MLGLSAWKQGDRDRAVAAFEQVLEKDSTHVKSQLNLSRVLIEQGKAQDALSTSRRRSASIRARAKPSDCSAA